MTWHLAAIILVLAIAIALPLALLLNRLDRWWKFRKLVKSTEKSLAMVADIVVVTGEMTLGGQVPTVRNPGQVAAGPRSTPASVTEIGALTSKRVTTKGQ